MPRLMRRLARPGRAQKCSRFHPLSAFNGPMRTCAEKLALQTARRRARVLASGRVPRTGPSRGEAADAAASARAHAAAEASGDSSEEAATPAQHEPNRAARAEG